MRIVVATRNRHKLKELERILAEHRLEPLPEGVELPPETGATFAENALIKARAAAAALGVAVLGEDSGIEAEALGGAPGIRSARFASNGEQNASDQANNEKLLALCPPGSGLRYVCALAYVDPQRGVEEVFWGRCEGRLAAAPRGAGGFGYDPLFIPLEQEGERTIAELEPREKDRISHRGKAARAFAAYLKEVDRGAGGNGDPHQGVAGVAGEQGDHRDNQAGGNGGKPGDPGELHRENLSSGG